MKSTFNQRMAKTLTLIVFLARPLITYGQGLVNFRNDSTTLISADGVPMPASETQQFNFAMFLAPSATVSSTGITPSFSDSVWQNVGGYNTSSAIVPGRINGRLNLDVGTPSGYSGGSSVDFIIRGWSANAGTTWSEALANWNNGAPLLPMFIGSSTVGNDLRLGDDVSVPTVFGPLSYQVGGFNMIGVPEPSALALAGLGAATLWFFRRRSP